MPISLLPTLRKTLESVVAERILALVEEHTLLPKAHFGVRKQRSTALAETMLGLCDYKGKNFIHHARELGGNNIVAALIEKRINIDEPSGGIGKLAPLIIAAQITNSK